MFRHSLSEAAALAPCRSRHCFRRTSLSAPLRTLTTAKQHDRHSRLDAGVAPPSTILNGSAEETPAKEDHQRVSDPVRSRSFLLDAPRKPPSKRSSPSRDLPGNAIAFEQQIANNPYASILATPLRQCLYTRKSLPSAFMTKLIQAAADSPRERSWIVPEQIIPRSLSPHSSRGTQDRHGMGKWVFSGFKVMESMVKEGKYKIIASSAYMRPDIMQLVYAQWTIRVAHEFHSLSKLSPRRRMPMVKLTPAAEPRTHTGASQDATETVLLNAPTHRPPLCVLFFQNGLLPFKHADGDPVPLDPTLKVDIDITHPDLPSFESYREHGPKTVTVCGGKKATATVPLYDMNQLFRNHPEGLLAIQHACSGRPLDLHSPGQDPHTQWVGIVESSWGLPIATGLWKLSSLLPKPDTTPSPVK
ncbi:hypothetical protein KVV02_006723 [Mortierella alpina]|uniref:Uncharacterized protein n=1 Tax=Mortierella alpina TaxID=64518 RepID=A0A9P8A0C6_MORAP|nr:hypothetical protein KVV02_006723 [Mortierella alpina]